MTVERVGSGRPRRRALGAGVLALLLSSSAACGGDDSADVEIDPSIDGLLDGVELGAGWVEVPARRINPFPESIEPPCPSDPEMPFVDVDEVAEAEIENAERRMDVNHTVATFEGEPGGEAEAQAAEVQAAWVRMDCSESDFTQTALEDLPPGVDGIRLTATEGRLNQVLLLRHGDVEVAFLIVSGDDDDPVDLARRLADNFAASRPAVVVEPG